ncbi:MAG: hypothetical protein AVDCRST_MAG88-2718 [uncultured Thermomicrobiales bacterium]|uniref:Uncharacterized protein n=1 Tax=uncultured Thermomicrobiales bacterium TaxID=1645740 RepID=A0A6J4VC53_9BACT|nr:MAG: hypothetical protein AVDCRST_MAG88-2718 [uncultured Thermomicrobiales bacterium]
MGKVEHAPPHDAGSPEHLVISVQLALQVGNGGRRGRVFARE